MKFELSYNIVIPIKKIVIKTRNFDKFISCVNKLKDVQYIAYSLNVYDADNFYLFCDIHKLELESYTFIDIDNVNYKLRG